MADKPKPNLFWPPKGPPASAYTRINRVPVDIFPTPEEDLGGSYTPPSGIYKGEPGYEQGRIFINSALSGPDRVAALKHEMVHEFFGRYPDAYERMEKLMSAYRGRYRIGFQPMREAIAYAVGSPAGGGVPDDFTEHVQRSLLQSAAGPEQQRLMRSILSMLPVRAYSPEALGGSNWVFSGTNIPSIQEMLQPQPSWWQRMISGR